MLPAEFLNAARRAGLEILQNIKVSAEFRGLETCSAKLCAGQAAALSTPAARAAAGATGTGLLRMSRTGR